MAFLDFGDGIFLIRGSSKNLVFTIYPGTNISFLLKSKKLLCKYHMHYQILVSLKNIQMLAYLGDLCY